MSVRGARWAAVVGLCLGILVPKPVSAQDDEIGIARGATPPAVTLADLDGRPVSLAQWVGKKPVVLEFWATWCPLCAALFPRFEATHRRFGDSVQVVVVAVGVNQSPGSIKRHLARHPLPFPVLWDGNGAAVRAFQAPGTSYVVMLDATGKVVYTGYGEDQDIEGEVAKRLRAP